MLRTKRKTKMHVSWSNRAKRRFILVFLRLILTFNPPKKLPKKVTKLTVTIHEQCTDCDSRHKQITEKKYSRLRRVKITQYDKTTQRRRYYYFKHNVVKKINDNFFKHSFMLTPKQLFIIIYVHLCVKRVYPDKTSILFRYRKIQESQFSVLW